MHVLWRGIYGASVPMCARAHHARMAQNTRTRRRDHLLDKAAMFLAKAYIVFKEKLVGCSYSRIHCCPLVQEGERLRARGEGHHTCIMPPI